MTPLQQRHHRNRHDALACLEQMLEVLGEASEPVEPAEGSFDNPAARQDLEALCALRSPDDYRLDAQALLCPIDDFPRIRSVAQITFKHWLQFVKEWVNNYFSNRLLDFIQLKNRTDDAKSAVRKSIFTGENAMKRFTNILIGIITLVGLISFLPDISFCKVSGPSAITSKETVESRQPAWAELKPLGSLRNGDCAEYPNLTTAEPTLTDIIEGLKILASLTPLHFCFRDVNGDDRFGMEEVVWMIRKVGGLLPVISEFTATPARITAGQGSTLSWSVTGADSLSIDQGIGAVSGNSIAVAPTFTTAYTLTAANFAGNSSRQTTVEVEDIIPEVSYRVGPDRTYKTLQDVAALLIPGDVVEVDGDHTYPGGVVFSRSGTPAKKIVIRGVRINDRRPVISGGSNGIAYTTPWPYSGPEGGHHYVLEGFEVAGAEARGIYHQANDLTIGDCFVRDCPANGILGADQGSGSLLLEYTEIARCGLSGSGAEKHQIYMATDEVNRPGSVFRMQHCYIHSGNGGNNVKTRAERNEIYYNWIEGAYYHELELIGPDGDADGGNPLLKREDSDVVGNVLIKKRTAANNNPDFSVIRIGGDGTGESRGRYRFLNNTVICGAGAVFRMFDALESVEIQNNVLYNPAGDVLFKRTVEAKWVSGQEVISGKNNWVKTGVQQLPAQLTGTVMGDHPGFADFSQDNLFPAENSPLVNAGVLPTESPPGFEFPEPLPAPLKLPPRCAAESPGTALNRIISGTIDIGAFEYNPSTGVIFVNSGYSGDSDGSEERPFAKIQDAVTAAAAGNTIRVAQGIYNENIVMPSTKGLILLGGYQNGNFNQRDARTYETVIRGSAASPVIWIEYTGGYGDSQHYEIGGFTIENGQRGVYAINLGNGGMASLKVANNMIQKNSGLTGSNDYGGGVFSRGMIPEIRNNIIRNNRCGKAAGIAVQLNTADYNFLIEGNIIENNEIYSDHGAGAGVQAYKGVIKNNIFRNNRILESWGWGGGLIVDGNTFAGFSNDIYIELSDNIYSGNEAPSGGSGLFIDEGANVRMKNELIIQNRSGSARNGPLYVDGPRANADAKTVLENCTIADNIGDDYSSGHAVYVEGGSEVIARNSIFWGNRSSDNQDDFYLDASSSLAVAYSIYTAGKLGDGAFTILKSIQSDPLFADASAGDYHLKSKTGRWHPALQQWVTDAVHSPGIDTGDPAYPYHHEPAPNGSRINMGVYGNTPQASKCQ